MSNYFKNFPKVNYRFGNNESPVEFQNISAYIDIIDQVKEYGIFYESYNIQNGQRPDQISFELYDTPNYYWTFYLLNDSLRTGGWPISDASVYLKGKEYYPNMAFTTDGTCILKESVTIINSKKEEEIFWIPSLKQVSLAMDKNFVVGSWIYFRNSKTVGKILKIDQDLGLVTTDAVGINFILDDVVDSIDEESAQIILNGNKDFVPTYKLAEMSIHKVYDQWDSPHHYENPVTKDWIYPTVSAAPPWFIDQNSVTTRQSVSYIERLLETNDDQKIISVLKPDIIREVVKDFNRLIRENR
jgi:hypothetical protein